MIQYEADICWIIKVKTSADSIEVGIECIDVFLNDYQKCRDNSLAILHKTYAALVWKKGDFKWVPHPSIG